MRKLFWFVFLGLIFSCTNTKNPILSEGVWLMDLHISDSEVLPFNFNLNKTEAGIYIIEIFNAEEKIKIDEIEIIGDSIIIRPPVFQGYLAGHFTNDKIVGQFIKEDLDRIVPFVATFGIKERFRKSNSSAHNITGIWETEFSKDTEDSYLAKGIFKQTGDNVTGTFRTTTGDYRYLEGVMSGDSLKISTFDGAHAFLFTAKAGDSVMKGTFYSGNHFKEPFEAKRNDTFELINADSLTFLKKGYDKLEFSFPDGDGTIISLSDNRFNNKVTLVQIMGTWCPNCLDETKFYVDFLKKNTDKEIEMVALAFEYAKTPESAFKSIARLKKRIGVEYPILLAQYGSSDKEEAQKKLPMLNHVISYPTTIYIDKNAKVRKIHTGFNGPATGEKHREFKKEFNTYISSLLAEEVK